jgi:hypothetical protein
VAVATEIFLAHKLKKIDNVLINHGTCNARWATLESRMKGFILLCQYFKLYHVML